jgi:hypothetical protein
MTEKMISMTLTQALQRKLFQGMKNPDRSNLTQALKKIGSQKTQRIEQ